MGDTTFAVASDRRYNPTTHELFRDSPNDIVRTSAAQGTRHLLVSGSMIDSSRLVVATDGACRGNGTPNAVATWGVYFGENSALNIRGYLPGERQTNQRAELHAVYEALNSLRWGGQPGRIYREIIIMNDSAYVTNALCDWIYDWKQNDYWTRDGPVANKDAFVYIDHLIQDLENMGCGVKFWQVPRHFNQDADRLANSVFG
jgi:ribonuclease HI